MVSESKLEVTNATNGAASVTAQVTAQVTESRHVFLLSLNLALAYLLIIVYASLQPFRNWRLPAADVYGFLTEPFPRYITLTDVLINISAYIPLGFMLALGLRRWLRPMGAVVAGMALTITVSIAMESIQMFLPARIPSNVDVLANSVGGLIGALAAPLFLPSRTIGARVVAWRDRLFVPGALTDIGIVVACLWIVTHLNPWTQVFGTGLLRQTFDLPELFIHTPSRLLSAEATVVFFNLLGIGLLLSTLLRVEVRRGIVICTVIATALALKMLLSAVLGKPHGIWAWMTPGAMLGLLLGATLLSGLLVLNHRARLLLAGVCILLALAAINLAPENPYFSLPRQLTSGRASHFLSFSGILRALSELWPLLALSYLCAAGWRYRRPGTPVKHVEHL
jgi:VanZ family protein